MLKFSELDHLLLGLVLAGHEAVLIFYGDEKGSWDLHSWDPVGHGWREPLTLQHAHGHTGLSQLLTPIFQEGT